MNELFWLLLPVAAASGWWLAQRGATRTAPALDDHTPDYFKGLNYLLNEQPDKAIDVFLKIAEVDSETVETHLALGNLFRRRGEVDRAIRIHQNLIARPTLNREQRAQALLELGQDYMRAGLFDRAESLFKELGGMKMYQEQSLQNLRIIYQQEKDWQQSLDVARELEQLTGDSLGTERAHYYCELAVEAIDRQEVDLANANLAKAQACDDGCVRATLLQAQLEIVRGSGSEAIDTLKRVEQQDAAYLSEALPTLRECYQQIGNQRELTDYLKRLYQRNKSVVVALALTDMLRIDQGDQAAIDFLGEYLQRYPDLDGLERLVTLNLSHSEQLGLNTLVSIQQMVRNLMVGRPSYQCNHCGFGAKTLYWQCPGCKTWSSIKPLEGLDCATSGK